MTQADLGGDSDIFVDVFLNLPRISYYQTQNINTVPRGTRRNGDPFAQEIVESATMSAQESQHDCGFKFRALSQTNTGSVW